MRQRGRKSGAALSTVIDVGRQAPARPPAELDGRLPTCGGASCRPCLRVGSACGGFPILVEYCRHTCTVAADRAASQRLRGGSGPRSRGGLSGSTIACHGATARRRAPSLAPGPCGLTPSSQMDLARCGPAWHRGSPGRRLGPTMNWSHWRRDGRSVTCAATRAMPTRRRSTPNRRAAATEGASRPDLVPSR